MGTWGQVDFITCMREATGKTIIAYIPQDADERRQWS